MDFLREEFQDLQLNPEEYKNNFQDSAGCVSRKTILLHLLKYLIHIKNQYKNLPQESKYLKSQNIKNLRQEDTTEHISKMIGQQYQQMVKAKRNGEVLEASDIFWLVSSTFKMELAIVLTLFIFSSLFRLASSFMILMLFETIADQNYKNAYIYSGLIILFWYLYQLTSNAGFVTTYQLGNHIKTGLSMLLHAKISKLTSYVIKNAVLGTITNLLSNDIAILEIRLMDITYSISVPILTIGITVILQTRIGWTVFVGLAILVLHVILSNFISKKNGMTVGEINHYKDQRVQITSQTIDNIKYVKLYGWELPFKRNIERVRANEMKCLKKLALGRSIDRSLAYIIGYLSTLVIYVLASEVTDTLTFAIIFSTLEMMATLKQNLITWIMGVGFYYQLKATFQRFANIFKIQQKSMIKINQETKEPMQQMTPVININEANSCPSKRPLVISLPSKSSQLSQPQRKLSKDQIVQFVNFNGYWKQDFDKPSLNNINYSFFSKKIYGITGKVGSGKSGLLGAIIQEMPYYSGSLTINGKISYVEQEPIVFSDTVKNNIIFGRKFDQNDYDNAVSLACLKDDFALLSEKDQTMIGQKGITLSGGQKARLALARAIYEKADIYIFDDPLSAVDAKVAKKLFEGCLRILASEKTVILVTHQINYINQCDEVIVMQDGSIMTSGTPADVAQQLAVLSQIVKPKIQQNPEQEQETDPFNVVLSTITQDKISQASFQRILRTSSQHPHSHHQFDNRFQENDVHVSLDTYKKFFFSAKSNYCVVPLSIFFFILSQGVVTVYYRLLADFDKIQDGTSEFYSGSVSTYWIILSIIMFIFLLILFTKFFTANMAIINASSTIHQNMIEAIIHCPCKYFDKTPSGILINKFSTDVGLVDINIVFGVWELIEGPIMIVTALANLVEINLYFLIPAVILMVCAVLFLLYSREAILGCKQLDLQKKSPIFHCYSQTMNGLTQIKLYDQRKAQILKFSKIFNQSMKVTMAFDMIARGFSFYQTLFAVVMMAIGIVMGLFQIDVENRGLYGVTVVYLIAITGSLYRYCKQIIMVESLMVSGQRMLQLENLDKEKALRTAYDIEVGLLKEYEAAQRDEEEHQEWPQNPTISFENFSARYDENLPLVVSNLNLRIEANQKIGIIGRTGAGKSSIIQALFRIFQPQQGSKFTIDGRNALAMGLHSLRQHISVISQVPFLFKGTIKENIDPLSTASEQRLWQVLEATRLGDHIRGFEKGLETNVENISSSFSVGQKQLLCMARALLQNNKILVLDEATSNVDMGTDAFIQKIIRQKFSNTTVITIAHRLITIADYDKVIVMNKGQVQQQGAPWQLIEKKGQFYNMVKYTGNDAEKIIRKARGSYKLNIE